MIRLRLPPLTRLWRFAAAAAVLTACVAGPAAGEALLLVEADSGKVLQAENATYPWYPASVTKLMTAYVTLRAVKDGRISIDTPFVVSANALAQAPTKMGFKIGTIVTVDNALKMLMVKSANDMAVLLAEGVSGSIEAFADEMNAAARRLGMTQTSYVNPNGLPADGQVTSARDLAILARALIREFPEYDAYWHLPGIKFGRRVMRNYNTLIDRYPGADGMKTGFICASGFNLVASATRGGRRLIAVVLGAPSSSVRAYKAAKLLEQGFNSSGLSWLVPSLGNVNALTPINAAPPNLRDEMCGPHRKRPAAEDEEAEASNDNGVGEAGSPMAFMLSNLRGSTPSTPKISELLSANSAMSPPVAVFTGRVPPTTAAAAAAQESQIVAGKAKKAKKAKAPAKKSAKTRAAAVNSTAAAGGQPAAKTGSAGAGAPHTIAAPAAPLTKPWPQPAAAMSATGSARQPQSASQKRAVQ